LEEKALGRGLFLDGDRRLAYVSLTPTPFFHPPGDPMQTAALIMVSASRRSSDLTGLEDLSGLWQEMPFLEEMASLGIDLTGLEDLSGLWPGR